MFTAEIRASGGTSNRTSSPRRPPSVARDTPLDRRRAEGLTRGTCLLLTIDTKWH
jgi:hypothetical protein